MDYEVRESTKKFRAAVYDYLQAHFGLCQQASSAERVSDSIERFHVCPAGMDISLKFTLNYGNANVLYVILCNKQGVPWHHLGSFKSAAEFGTWFDQWVNIKRQQREAKNA